MWNKLKTLLVLTVAAVVYTLVFQVFYNWMRYNELLPLPVPNMILSLCMNIVPIWILVILNYIIVWKIPHGKKAFPAYAFGLAISMSMLVVINLLFKVVMGRGVEWAGTIFSNLLIYISIESIYHQYLSKLVLRQQALAKQQILQYQYEVLKAQVNPHFLFNSFNILYSFIPPEQDKARECVLNLSHIYRYTLNHGDKTQVSVKEELQFLKAYNEILKIRFHNNFRVEIIGMDKFENRNIIPYSLQMLVENVTKHNMITSTQPMIVKITADETGITVSNPIRKKDVDVATHFGLQYLSLLYESHKKKFSTICDNITYTAHIPYLPTI